MRSWSNYRFLRRTNPTHTAALDLKFDTSDPRQKCHWCRLQKLVHLPSASSTLCQLQVTNSHKFHLPPTIAQVLHQPPMLMERSESAKSNFHAKTELWSMPVRGVPCMNLSLSLTHTHTHTVQNAFWGVVTNPNGQCPVLGAPAGLNPPIWQITPWSQVFCT